MPSRKSAGGHRRRSHADDRKRKLAFLQRGVGRPKGKKSLLEDPDRFQIALCTAIDAFYEVGPYDAADLITLLLSDEPIAVSDVDGTMINLATRLQMATIKGRSETLAAKCRNLALSPIEVDWLATSMMHLKFLDLSFSSNTPMHKQIAFRAQALSELCRMEWQPTLQILEQKFTQVLASNLPPFDDRLGKRGRAFLKLLKDRGRI